MERSGISSFLIGVGMGATMAIVFAPSSGSKARAQITKAAAEGASYFKKEVHDAVLSAVERGKDQITRHKEGVTQAIKRGSQAYRRAVS
jgi:gas vesicle protein